MYGGTAVRTQAGASEWTRRLGRKVSVGDLIHEPPCLNPGELKQYRKAYGRRCPRVRLPESLSLSARLAFLALHDSNRLTAVILSVPLRRRRLLLDRVDTVLGDDRVAEAWEARRDAPDRVER